MNHLFIDIETTSGANLSSAGAYRYAEDEHFRVLLFGYATDNDPIRIVNLERGERVPGEIIEGLARDVLLDAMQRLADANYPVVLHLANKVVVESEEPAALMAMSAIMEQPPHWANELQLTTQGYACNRYLEKKQRTSRR